MRYPLKQYCFWENTDNNDKTEIHRFYPGKSIRSVSSVFPCSHPF